ncbi:MAG: hypothetical protein ACE5JS_21740, partial [Nitrospinota bacterium]
MGALIFLELASFPQKELTIPFTAILFDQKTCTSLSAKEDEWVQKHMGRSLWNKRKSQGGLFENRP